MDRNDREVIDGLFSKVRQAEDQSPPRDAEAEALIRQYLSRQPAAPYYMAQAIVVQEQALAAQQARIDDLERQLAERPAGGGFFSSLFGGGSRTPAPPPQSAPMAGYGQPPGYGQGYGQGQGPGYGYGYGYGQGPGYGHHAAQGGFMSGALQTAVAVAGGVLIGNALAGMMAPDAPDAAAEEPPAEEAAPEEPSFDEEL